MIDDCYNKYYNILHISVFEFSILNEIILQDGKWSEKDTVKQGQETTSIFF